ncbi:MAG: prepilin-type N-terminal cleavage/methylation domain-containing protein [Desulfosarcina sp.]|nr:prepilin-type N-terminal cleavage/methylation domain-containing protein [Desulfobacterales bacterium]
MKMAINLIQNGSRPRPLKQNRSESGGFTLVELLVVLAMSMILMGAVVSTMASLKRSYTTHDVAAATQQDIRMAMTFMTRDIKLAGLDPLTTAGAGIERAESAYIRVTVDRIDTGAGDTEANGGIDDTNFERVSYFRDPSDNTLKIRLYEGSTASQTTQTLANNITNLQFVYFDVDGAVTTVLSDIRRVGITLTAQAPAGLEGTMERTYTTRVRCRNLSLP